MVKRPVPKYDFKAFGAAIKTAWTGRKESRKKVGQSACQQDSIKIMQYTVM